MKDLNSVEELQEWLISYLSEMLDLAPDEISTTTSFARYGLASIAFISLISALSERLGREIDPTIPYRYPTIEDLAKHLSSS